MQAHFGIRVAHSLAAIAAGLFIWHGAHTSGQDLPTPEQLAPKDRPPLPTQRPPPEASALSNMVFRPIGPGVFELGKLRFSQADRSITFPAFANSKGGPLEYFLVTTYGKTHESVLRTEADPIHIQLALLLLGATGDPQLNGDSREGAGNGHGGSGPINRPGARTFKGDKVSIDVSWSADGKPDKCPAEELVFNEVAKKPLSVGNWVYNGSVVRDGRFYAQSEGSIVSLITDSTALINNVALGHENDDIWTVNTNRVPSLHTPVEVTIRVISPDKK